MLGVFSNANMTQSLRSDQKQGWSNGPRYLLSQPSPRWKGTGNSISLFTPPEASQIIAYRKCWWSLTHFYLPNKTISMKECAMFSSRVKVESAAVAIFGEGPQGGQQRWEIVVEAQREKSTAIQVRNSDWGATSVSSQLKINCYSAWGWCYWDFFLWDWDQIQKQRRNKGVRAQRAWRPQK